MFRQRYFGVDEGNAIENIIAYEMREKKGIATEADRQARDEARKMFNPPPRKSRTSERVKTTATSVEYSGPMDPRSVGEACGIVVAVYILFAVVGLVLLLVVSAVHSMMT